jgi:hypothetical protein
VDPQRASSNATENLQRSQSATVPATNNSVLQAAASVTADASVAGGDKEKEDGPDDSKEEICKQI